MKPYFTILFLAGAAMATAQTNPSIQNNANTMKVAVWDTYVKSSKGHVLHFDIIVPEALKDSATIYSFGKQYLASVGEASATLSTQECQFCHIEAPTADVVADIARQGYHILEMDSIPAVLPPNPTRRDMVLHLRAHHAKYRFANFQGVTEEALRQIIAEGK